MVCESLVKFPFLVMFFILFLYGILQMKKRVSLSRPYPKVQQSLTSWYAQRGSGNLGNKLVEFNHQRITMCVPFATKLLPQAILSLISNIRLSVTTVNLKSAEVTFNGTIENVRYMFRRDLV